MIERYSRQKMRDIWTEENKFNAYLKVEILANEAWSELGRIPREDVARIAANARFTVDRIKEIDSCFTMEYYFKNVQLIFDRVFDAR